MGVERNSNGWSNREGKRRGWRSTVAVEQERLTVEEAAGGEKRRAKQSISVEEGYLCNNS